MSRSAVLLAAALLVAAVSCGTPDPTPTKAFTAVENKALPDLQMKTLDGETIRLSAFRGKPVLVNFWASWCTPCRQEFPHLDELESTGRARVIGVVFEDTVLRALAFQQKMGADWAMVNDPGGVIAKGFKVTRPPGIPQTAFIDSDGVFRVKILGQIDKRLLEETLSEIEG